MASLPRPSPVISSPQMSHQPQHFVDSMKSYPGIMPITHHSAPRNPYDHQNVSYQAPAPSVLRPVSTSSTYKSYVQAQASAGGSALGGSVPQKLTAAASLGPTYSLPSSVLSQGAHQAVTYQTSPYATASYQMQPTTTAAQMSPSGVYKPLQQSSQQSQTQHRSIVYASQQQVQPPVANSHSPFIGAEHTYVERSAATLSHSPTPMPVGASSLGASSSYVTSYQPERYSTSAAGPYVTYTASSGPEQHEIQQHSYVERVVPTTPATTFPSFAAGRQESGFGADPASRSYVGRASHVLPLASQLGQQSTQTASLGGLQSSHLYPQGTTYTQVPEVNAAAYEALNVEDSEIVGAVPLVNSSYVANVGGDFIRSAPQSPTHPDGEMTQPSVPTSDVSKLPQECFTPIAVGDKLPTAHIDLHGVCVNLQEFFEDRCGILFGLVGAFYPPDTKKVVPDLLRCMDSFEKQVDFVGCLVVNDPFVVKAWAKRLGMTDQFTFVADADAKFTKALGMAQYLPEKGLGVRSRRFALVVGPRSKVQWVGFDEDAFASSVLQVVPRFVRTPWKSFIVGISYDKKKGETEPQVGNSVTEAIASIRLQLAHQGFCSEADWQLVLSDNIPDIFKPTRENIMSGLKWLVEGTQAGDVLCLYFAGRGHRVMNADGTETRGILPMDWETAGVITESEMYDILAANVPQYCRMTLILDIEGEESVQCPLPYCAPCLQSSDGDPGVQLLPVSALNEAWVNKFQLEERPKGEVLTISLEGPGRVPAGCLANLMNSTVSTELRDPVSEESDQPQIVEVPISFRDKMDRMTTQLQEWGLQKYVMFGSSFPLDLKEDFSLADILPQAQGN